MNTETTHESHDALNRILGAVDFGGTAPKKPELVPDGIEPTPAEHAVAYPIAQDAYLGSRGPGVSVAESKRLACEAYALSVQQQREAAELAAMADASAVKEDDGPATERMPEHEIDALRGEFTDSPQAHVVDLFDALKRSMESSRAKSAPAAPVIPLPVPKPAPAPLPAPPPPPPAAAPLGAPLGAQDAEVVCPVGKTRAQRDRDAAKAAGFSIPDPVYALGTVVVQLGADNARRSRIDHEAQPLVGEYCEAFLQRIAQENRRMVTVQSSGVRMDDKGAIYAVDEMPALPISYEAFQSTTRRLGYSGADYLARCPVDLRGVNVNAWSCIIARREHEQYKDSVAEAATTGKPSKWEPQEVVFRVRDTKSGPEIFAAVSPGYTAFDCDKIAAAFAEASPADARGTVDYDGTRARFTAMFHSTVEPEHYVAGEIFRAGVHVRTDDTGRGGIHVRACIWQNRCRNLLILSESFIEIGSLIHMGDYQKLVERFRALLAKAYGVLEPFRSAWGSACEENVQETLRVVDGEKPATAKEAAAGVFRGLLSEKRVKISGKVEEIVDDLVKLWEGDDSSATMVHELSRAGIMNALTAYAHNRLSFEDIDAQDELQAAAGELLVGRKGGAPAPLPYMGLPS